MKYRLRIAKAEENELERMPLVVALQLEKHLQHIAELAGDIAPSDPVWNRHRDPESGLLRFELHGFCVLYEVDRATQTLVVSSVKRVHTSAPCVSPGVV